MAGGGGLNSFKELGKRSMTFKDLDSTVKIV